MAGDAVVHVVEDDAGMRDALELLLQSAGLAVRCYPSAETLLPELDRSAPVCLLTDVKLPGMDGISLFRTLVGQGAAPATVVITGHGDIAMAVAALKEGVLDFVEKPFDPALLLESVREAVQRAVSGHERKVLAADIEARRATLTPRETEVLALLLDGHPNKTIAARLGMSIRTTEHHRARIMEKMAARSLSQLVKMLLSVRR
jgi:two-component system response regulator FixJ